MDFIISDEGTLINTLISAWSQSPSSSAHHWWREGLKSEIKLSISTSDDKNNGERAKDMTIPW